jgi:hypothetical protein
LGGLPQQSDEHPAPLPKRHHCGIAASPTPEWCDFECVSVPRSVFEEFFFFG